MVIYITLKKSITNCFITMKMEAVVLEKKNIQIRNYRA